MRNGVTVLQWVGFALAMSTALPSLGAAAAREKLWAPGSRLNVCFYGGTPEARAAVAQTARTWSGVSSITLDFGVAPAFRLCNAAERSQVRVGFRQAGSWSFLGTDSVNVVSQDEPSLNIPPDRLQSDAFASLVLRSFGHALGLRSDFFADEKCSNELNLNAVDVAVRGEFKFDSAISAVTPFAKVSALNPAISPSLFVNGEASKCYVQPSATLTKDDIAALRAVYKDSATAADAPSSTTSARMMANTQFGVDAAFLSTASSWDDRNVEGAAMDPLQPVQIRLESTLNQLRTQPPTPEIASIVTMHDAGQFPEARKLALSAGQKGQGAAYLIVAQHNLHSIGSPRDSVEVVKWIRAAADKNEPMGSFLLGYCYEVGIGVAKNPMQAILFYSQAEGMPLADERLARLHMSEGAPYRNPQKALELYRKAASAGLNAAKRSLAFLVDQGIGGQASKTEALALAVQAAQAGDAPAMLLTALLHFDAVSPESSMQLGIQMLKDGAAKEFSLATAVLAMLYEFGWVDDKPDRDRAIALYKQIANAGLPGVQRHLAGLLANGAASDRRQMVELLQAAASHGDLQAQLMLSDLYKSGVDKIDEVSGEHYTLKPDPAVSTLWRLIASIYAPSMQRKKIIDETSALVLALNPREWIGAHEPAVTWVRRRERLDTVGSATDRGARPDTPELNPKQQGSGVVVSRDGHVLTNFHVVEGCSRISARIGEASGQLRVLKRDPNLDLAVGRLEWLPDARAALREEVPANNPPVLVLGYPDTAALGDQAEVWPGHITSYEGLDGNTARFRVTATTNPGKSGGGVFDSAGNLVGISVSRGSALLQAQSGLQNIYIAIKSDSIASALRSWNIKYDKADAAASPLAPDVLPAQAKQNTVLLTCFG